VSVIEVEIESAGKPIGRATALLLRRGPQPDVRPWQAPEWDVPAPDQLASEDTPESRFIPLETRSIVPGGYRAPGRKRIWLRELCPLVDDEPWTPLMRAAAVADLTNALANTDEQPNHFINADVTLYLGRMPDGEWIGLDVTGHTSADGVSIAACDVYDTAGRCGAATVAALAAPAPLALPG
jgi:Thioesterase-like superfamily